MKTVRLVLLATTMALAGGLVAQEARAEYPAPAPYIGIYGGGTIPLRDWDLGEYGTRVPGNFPKASPMVGARLGVQLLPPLAIEGEFGYLPLRVKQGDTNTTITYNANLLYHFLPGNWSPYVLAGGGVYQNTKGNLGKEVDWRAHLGLGLRGLTTDWLAVRAEVRDVATDGLDNWGGNNIEATIGLDFFMSSAEKKPGDRDGDGVPDSEDACPDVRGSAANKGCAGDSDNDGVPDVDDKCPQQAGPAVTGGCPDGDKDGIADGDDACPKEAGTVALKGCPDSDNDGIGDATDKCPKEAGVAALEGCPDADGDGVADSQDACPQQSGSAALRGCPDRDKDGVADNEDKCPDAPGLKEHAGCLPDAVKAFTGAIKGINFATASAQITPKSFPVLDSAVKVLNDYPSLRIRIEGHTDNVGKPETNKMLSQNRAEAVKNYLISKGVSGDRLQTVGEGDAKPVQENKTEAGRAANRRIEFTPIGQE